MSACKFPCALSAFQHLETLALDVWTENNQFNPRAHALTERCMALCPTLRCIAMTNIATDSTIAFNRVYGSDSVIEISGFNALEELWREI